MAAMGLAPAAASGFAPPADAGDLAYAQLWYYRDNGGAEQGPYDTATMRAWYEADYLPDHTAMCPSYYGEVPAQMWSLSELYADPKAEAFYLASDALVAHESSAAPLSDPEFLPADKFEGARAGYAFKNDHYGVGYYRDEAPEKTITLETIEEEKRVKRIKANKLSGHAMPKFDAISS